MTQDRLPSMSRKPTARSNAGKSPQNERTASRLALAGIDGGNDKDRGAGQPLRHRLRNGRCPLMRSG